MKLERTNPFAEKLEIEESLNLESTLDRITALQNKIEIMDCKMKILQEKINEEDLYTRLTF